MVTKSSHHSVYTETVFHRKHIHYPVLSTQVKGCTVGCDYMGTVIQVGPKVAKDFNPGDRIAGLTHGVNAVEKEDGCFAEYAVVKGDVQYKVPDNVSDEDASTLGVGIMTVGQGLYQSLGLPLPGTEKLSKSLLIYGGSTATGSLAIQFAQLSGCQVITTCSLRNFALVKALGALEAFDYKDPDCAKKIRDYTNNKLTRVLDCISEGESPKISSEAISSQGGQISYLLAARHPRTDVKNKVSHNQAFHGSHILTHNLGNIQLHRVRRGFQGRRWKRCACQAARLRVCKEVLEFNHGAPHRPADSRAPG
jgi:NADPH:quinone reductase-like Zn-dependent oxidoreductase